MKAINQSSDFNEATKNPGIVLIDCHADWCAPCKVQKPILEKFEAAHPEVQVWALNIEEVPELASSFAVKAIPTLIWIRNGEIVSTEVGLKKEAQLESSLEKLR